MPSNVRKSRVPLRKRVVYRKRGLFRKKMQLARRIPSAPTPHSRLLAFRYNDIKNYVSTLGSLANGVYRINDLFDPDFSGVGHQSLFRDQMFAMYSNARVLAASIKASVSINNAGIHRVCIYPCQSGSADTDQQTSIERPGSKERMVSPNGSSAVVLKCYTSCDRYFGLRKGTTRTESSFVQTAAGPLPADKSMWYCVSTRDVTAATTNVFISVDIVQYVIFEQPIQVSGS